MAANPRNYTGGRFDLSIAAHNVGFLSSLGLQQATNGEIISNPNDRKVVAEF